MNTFLIDAAIHPMFRPVLAQIDVAVDASGPWAARALAAEALLTFSNLIELACRQDPETDALLGGSDVTVSDLIAMADHLGDRIESLSTNVQ